MTRSVKRVVLVLLAAAVLAFAAWMLWPRSIGDAVDLEGEDFYGFLVTLDVRDGRARQTLRAILSLRTANRQRQSWSCWISTPIISAGIR